MIRRPILDAVRLMILHCNAIQRTALVVLGLIRLFLNLTVPRIYAGYGVFQTAIQ